jgi:DMSO/TMAO reductase YedYZ molybdopterin-dependent catalytic subunit
MNGLQIPEERGFPFVVVAESTEGYNWVKWVTKIELRY